MKAHPSATHFALLVALFLPACGGAVGAAAPSPDAECLAAVIRDFQVEWPQNRTINIVAFGHSVPAGFAVTPTVRKADAYPRLLEDALAQRYPHAVFNVITSAVGGENSSQGKSRLDSDVLNHRPRVVLIDYALNDRPLPLAESRQNLEEIVDRVRTAGACPILLTPTWDSQATVGADDDALSAQAEMIRGLGEARHVPVADSLKAFMTFQGDRNRLMAQFNHPNRAGHELVVGQLLPLFAPR